MRKLALPTLFLAIFLNPFSAAAQQHPCAAHALKQAKKLLEFHFGPDDRMEIERRATPIRPLRNPAGQGKFDVLRVWAWIYKGRYRMHFIYAQARGRCALMGQEILEYANMSTRSAPSAAAPARRDRGSARPASAAKDVVGIWQGQYHCGQGVTRLKLTIIDRGKGEIGAEFSFSATTDNTGVPAGTFLLKGRYQKSRRELTLKPYRWLKRPRGYFAVGLTGTYDPATNSLTGSVDHESCEWFEVTRR